MSVRKSYSADAQSGRNPIPSLVVKRLSLYLGYFEQLDEKGVSTTSSRQLADALGLSAAQVRKDLGYLGQFGRPGVGYHVPGMVMQLRKVFGTNKVWNMAVVGVGSLGRALLRYKGFPKRGFRPVAAFDITKSKIGRKYGDITVQPMSELESTIKAKRIRLAILAVPARAAQEVAQRLSKAGVKGILNFAPVSMNLSGNTAVVSVDLAIQLEQLSYLVNTLTRLGPHRRKTRRKRKT